MRLIIGISGATGTIYGIRLLEILKSMPEVETHLVMSTTGKMNVAIETDMTRVLTYRQPVEGLIKELNN